MTIQQQPGPRRPTDWVAPLLRAEADRYAPDQLQLIWQVRQRIESPRRPRQAAVALGLTVLTAGALLAAAFTLDPGRGTKVNGLPASRSGYSALPTGEAGPQLSSNGNPQLPIPGGLPTSLLPPTVPPTSSAPSPGSASQTVAAPSTAATPDRSGGAGPTRTTAPPAAAASITISPAGGIVTLGTAQQDWVAVGAAADYTEVMLRTGAGLGAVTLYGTGYGLIEDSPFVVRWTGGDQVPSGTTSLWYVVHRAVIGAPTGQRLPVLTAGTNRVEVYAGATGRPGTVEVRSGSTILATGVLPVGSFRVTVRFTGSAGAQPELRLVAGPGGGVGVAAALAP